jgi:hypothetical protein
MAGAPQGGNVQSSQAIHESIGQANIELSRRTRNKMQSMQSANLFNRQQVEPPANLEHRTVAHLAQ